MVPLRLIVVLIVFALFVQNTCPHGFAGKTTVARTCGHCSLKEHHAASLDRQEGLTAGRTPVHYPFFVLSRPKPIQAYQRGPVASVEPGLTGRYTDALPAERLQPPRG
jgi:hypothetical protein